MICSYLLLSLILFLALVAFGGPVLGSVGALGFAGAAHAMDSPLMFALADFGFMINLFNLIPLGMMDGGRICGAISPYAGLEVSVLEEQLRIVE